LTFSLAFLTLQDCGPLEAIAAAASAGFQRVGLRLLPATAREAPYPLLTDDRLLRDVLAALADTGLEVGDVELVRLGPASRIESFDSFLERAGRLSARHVIVVNDDTEHARFCDNLGALCERAAPHGLTLDLEPMPWTAMTSLKDAAACIAQVAQPNAGLLVDVLHFHRCGSDFDTLRGLPDAWLNMFQICDAPRQFDPSPEAMQRLSRSARLLPGEGELDVLPLLARMPAHTTISVEVPNLRDAERFTPAERAARALQATKRVLAGLADQG